jgi:hypothetical protein
MDASVFFSSVLSLLCESSLYIDIRRDLYLFLHVEQGELHLCISQKMLSCRILYLAIRAVVPRIIDPSRQGW